MKIAMFVFNTGNGDRRLHRQASLLAAQGHQVRVYCFLSPPLPVREERGGYEILPPGVAMCVNHQTPIVRTGQGEFSALRLTRVISPRHSELVPLASQTKGWMNLLIAPSHADLPATGLPPSGRIRKVQQWSGGETIKQR